jgi:hypothetical protein
MSASRLSGSTRPARQLEAKKSLGRLQPRLVGSLRKCEEEAFAQGYCSLYPRVSNTRAWHKPAKMFTMWPIY